MTGEGEEDRERHHEGAGSDSDREKGDMTSGNRERSGDDQIGCRESRKEPLGRKSVVFR